MDNVLQCCMYFRNTSNDLGFSIVMFHEKPLFLILGRCYVPLYRDENNIVSPTVGTPRSPIFTDVLSTHFGVSQTPPFPPETQISSPKSPCDPQAVVKAFAGPMSPSQVMLFSFFI